MARTIHGLVTKFLDGGGVCSPLCRPVVQDRRSGILKSSGVLLRIQQGSPRHQVVNSRSRDPREILGSRAVRAAAGSPNRRVASIDRSLCTCTRVHTRGVSPFSPRRPLLGSCNCCRQGSRDTQLTLELQSPGKSEMYRDRGHRGLETESSTSQGPAPS